MANFFDTVRPEKLIQDFEKMGYNFVDVKKQNLKNMYTVIYSKSPYLLARMATDLQMEGISSNGDWNDSFLDSDWVFDEIEYIRIGPDGFDMFIINHRDSITLTSRNYLKVLGAILNCKK